MADVSERTQQPQRHVEVAVSEITDEPMHLCTFQSRQCQDLRAHGMVHLGVHERMIGGNETHWRSEWHVQAGLLEGQVKVQRWPVSAVDAVVSWSKLEHVVVDLQPLWVAQCADQGALGDRMAHAQNVFRKTTGSRQARVQEETCPECDDDPLLVVDQHTAVAQTVEAESTDVLVGDRLTFDRAVDVDA